jgi:hypothetical protein
MLSMKILTLFVGMTGLPMWSSYRPVMPSTRLSRIRRIMRTLEKIPHVNAVRLRSRKFNYEPESYTPVVIDELADLNKLTMVRPLRLEIETQFLVADEFRPAHARLARQIEQQRHYGILQHPAAWADQRHAGSHPPARIRMPKAGIEFHHLYVAGLPSRTTGTGKTRWPFTMWSTSPRGCGGKAADARCPATSSAPARRGGFRLVINDPWPGG